MEVIAIHGVGPRDERFGDELERNLFALIPPRAHSFHWENKTVAREIGARFLEDYRQFWGTSLSEGPAAGVVPVIEVGAQASPRGQRLVLL